MTACPGRVDGNQGEPDQSRSRCRPLFLVRLREARRADMEGISALLSILAVRHLLVDIISGQREQVLRMQTAMQTEGPVRVMYLNVYHNARSTCFGLIGQASGMPAHRYTDMSSKTADRKGAPLLPRGPCSNSRRRQSRTACHHHTPRSHGWTEDEHFRDVSCPGHVAKVDRPSIVPSMCTCVIHIAHLLSSLFPHHSLASKHRHVRGPRDRSLRLDGS